MHFKADAVSSTARFKCVVRWTPTGVEIYRKRNMKLKNLKIIFWGLCIAFCACKNNKLENAKATDTRLAETKKVLKIENYTYEENSETIEIISGIDNKKTMVKKVDFGC